MYKADLVLDVADSDRCKSWGRGEIRDRNGGESAVESR